ncbi:MAG: aldehyde dehydrogenase [Clostridiales bacterium]|nr:aldehyde dehydrogenase [Clostridiales bacterium]
MEERELARVVLAQRHFFEGGTTLAVNNRIDNLKKLREVIKTYEQEIFDALYADLGKSDYEVYMCEVALVLGEISFMLKHVRRLAKDKRVKTPLVHMAARSFVRPSPLGAVLIMSPWNYPFLLSLTPLVDALAAGNTVVLKPSAYAPHTGLVIQKIISECFDAAYVQVVLGGREANAALLKIRFDAIFFTGSKSVGREVMKHAAEHLTPVTLELGGKSPCIVDTSAKLTLAARRIVFGKFLNAGQTCVAPDYVLCDERIKEALIEALVKEIKQQFGHCPLDNDQFGKIVNQKHFDRLVQLIDMSKVVFGGHADKARLKIEPTVLGNIGWDDEIMQEEIFGPLLPIVTYRTFEEVPAKINALPSPLALYIFSENRERIDSVLKQCRFGGGCVNDTVIHLATSEMGFGGVGESGMGAYHGKTGFDTFTHYASIVDKKTWLDLPVRYQPYQHKNTALMKKMMK